MGFIMEKYTDGYAGLVVSFIKNESDDSFFAGDSAQEAMKHFNLYLENRRIRINTESELAVNTLSIAPDEAAEFRSMVNTLIASMGDTDAEKNKVLFPLWNPNNVQYTEGERVRYNDKLYKVLKTHLSQQNWNPENAPSLFSEVVIGNEIVEWIQPSSESGYMTGDKVLFEGEVYQSLIDNNVWSPSTYPAGWKRGDN